ncbi:Nn.00g051480.m01.CDS01 [Neocucurbitaria sp. VM-36]
MATNAPTLINLPPPPSDLDTPNEAPGTPNSTTTSMSELSTVAIKDGHRGHFPHHRNPAEAERADRISRLAGLERVAVSGRTPQGLVPGSAANPPPGYFDANNQPQIFRERSTVGSASATGSVGGRTTWASGSDVYDPDRMSEDQDVETSSMGGFSDEAASLVGFGEGARTPARQHSQIGSPAIGKASAVPGHLREQLPGSPMTGVSAPSSSGTTQTTSSVEQQKHDARNLDGMTYDENIIDTANRTPPVATQGRDGDSTSEQAIRERMRQRQAGPDVMDYEQQKEN